jgi:hypothetical protein
MKGRPKPWPPSSAKEPSPAVCLLGLSDAGESGDSLVDILNEQRDEHLAPGGGIAGS